MKKIIGMMMVVSVFIALFGFGCNTVGLLYISQIFIGVFTLMVWLYLAVSLIFSAR